MEGILIKRKGDLKIVTIIPAGGGSKRLKNKNVRLVKDKPMISYAINSCQNSKLIDEAVQTIKSEGNNKIILLHCTLCYPTEPKDVNLRIIQTLSSIYPHYFIGLSDHTMGIAIPIAAVALGAKVIEKHYTIDKTLLKSADHWLSVDPNELNEMVSGIRKVEEALDSGEKKVFDVEKITYKYDKRSIVARQNISKGATIKKDMLIMKRPGTGIPPKFTDLIIGRTAQKNIKEDSILKWGDF